MTFAFSAAALMFPGLMILAGVLDLTTMRIPNWLVVALLAGYAAAAPAAGLGLYPIGYAAAVAMIVFVAGFGCFAMGWIGGGDAKLAPVAVLWLGADHALIFLMWTALLGGALTLLQLAFRRAPLPAAWSRQDWIVRLHGGAAGVPYGIAMAAAALVVFPETIWMQGLAG